MIIPTLFGTTVGLKVFRLQMAQAPATVQLEDAWIAITGSQLTVRYNKDVFVVLRKMVGPHLATWIGVYRPAREIGYDRSGGFYGAGAWLIDSVVDAKLLTTVIINLADQIQSVTMDGDRFTQCILEARASFVLPTQTAALVATLSRVSAGCAPAGGNAFVIGDAYPLDVIEWAQRSMSASAFSKVIVGAPEHTPAGGVGSSTQLFPSLSLAIEGAYRRKVTAIENELEQTKVQAQKFYADLVKVQIDNKSLQEDLERAKLESVKARDRVHALQTQAAVISNPIGRVNQQDPSAQFSARSKERTKVINLPTVEPEKSSTNIIPLFLIAITFLVLLIFGLIYIYIKENPKEGLFEQRRTSTVDAASQDELDRQSNPSGQNARNPQIEAPKTPAAPQTPAAR